ncbi:MAG: sigma 54-interacting transcriptional regulator [Clostridiales bacterium]|nr:sigma 54-interacting transcriptional regulator [Clostridiales bacterium]
MKKTIAIATFYVNSLEFYSKQIIRLFGDTVEVKKYCIQDRSIEKGIDAELVLISSNIVFETVKRYIKNDAEVIVAKKTISKEGFNKILELPKNTKALLVNVSAEMAIETISLVYELGAKHIELTPAYPGNAELEKIDIAITPGEIGVVPKEVNTIINIGDRILDISTIMDIAIKLELEHLLKGKELEKYFNRVVTGDIGIKKMVGKSNRLESQLDILLQIIDEGIIVANKYGIIHTCNESAEKILGICKYDVLGKKGEEILPHIPFSEVVITANAIKEKLIKYKDIDIIVTVVPIKRFDTILGVVATVKRFSDSEKRQHRLRTKLMGRGHRAKYCFDDILGKSFAIKETIKIAKRMAKSESSVLIMGESGTGKELFAQAIHNYSERKEYQFVAINCAALPESLLESELFGYEEGAFTGARKGGKLGLFELAHNGTLFLDEIGEMPLNLQARLLRILQEKEVMRIGGDRVLKIDVRIIAATNRELELLVDKREFRQDLYFRLNVLPLKTPSIRERVEDIDLLIGEFKSEFNASFDLSDEVRDVFLGHRWNGNIRELRNYIEYFANLGEKTVKLEHLPFNCLKRGLDKKYITEEEKLLIDEFKQAADRSLSTYIFVLEELEKNYIRREHIGRRSLEVVAKKRNIFLSEQEIRKMLLILKKYRMVEILRGRGGSKITGFGIRALEALQRG